MYTNSDQTVALVNVHYYVIGKLRPMLISKMRLKVMVHNLISQNKYSLKLMTRQGVHKHRYWGSSEAQPNYSLHQNTP